LGIWEKIVVRAFARSIVETVRHPLVILDADLKVVVANAAFYRALETAPETIEGRGFFTMDGGLEQDSQLRKRLEDVALGHSSFRGHEVHYDAPGLGSRTLILNAHRADSSENDEPMILVEIEDETERRKAHGDLQQLNDDLERRVAERTAELETANRDLLNANLNLVAANRELEAFCYSVSHDLRAPLRAIDGFSQELLESYADGLDEQGRHYLRRVRAATQRMGQLIDDLLLLSRLTRSEMNRARVDLTALAGAVIAELRQAHPDRKVTFRAHSGLTAWADPRLIRIVLENLLGNAWKFTGRNAEAVIEFGCLEREDGPAFFVRDDGAGFVPEYAGKLFGAFQRLHSEREFPGTGIGLATVQRIVRRHGGEAWGEGCLGRGATFYFTIPPSEPRA
jgi:signal transduction histidine kinase